jgi:hypothetical protein
MSFAQDNLCSFSESIKPVSLLTMVGSLKLLSAAQRKLASM